METEELKEPQADKDDCESDEELEVFEADESSIITTFLGTLFFEDTHGFDSWCFRS